LLFSHNALDSGRINQPIGSYCYVDKNKLCILVFIFYAATNSVIVIARIIICNIIYIK
jgi:hypothetical protein